MTDNMFDKFVRDKLKDHQSTVPQGLWEKIRRDAKQQPKPAAWLFPSRYWLVAFIIFTTIASGVILWQLNTETPGASSRADNAPGEQTRLGVEPVNPKTENNIKTNSEDNPGAPVKGQLNQSTEAINTESSRYPEKLTNKKTSPVIKEAIHTNQPLNITKPFNRNNDLFTRKNNPYQENNNLSFSTPETDGNTSNIYQPYILGQTAPGNSGISDIKMIDKDLSQFKYPGVECPPGSGGNNNWFIELYGSPDLAFKSVRSNGFNNSYLQKKDSTETQQIGYTAGVRISKSIGEHLLLKTGLQLSQVNERFDLRTENERRIITVITIRTIPISGGGDTTIRDTSTYEQIGYSVRRTYNRYRSIDIPLLLSYEFGNENLRMAINAGVIFNLHTWYNGEALNDSMAVVSLNSKQTNIYKQNWGLGLYAGFSFIKPLGNQLDIFAEPYYRFNLSSMSRNAGFTQRINAAGLSIGLRYRLTKAANN